MHWKAGSAERGSATGGWPQQVTSHHVRFPAERGPQALRKARRRLGLPPRVPADLPWGLGRVPRTSDPSARGPHCWLENQQREREHCWPALRGVFKGSTRRAHVQCPAPRLPYFAALRDKRLPEQQHQLGRASDRDLPCPRHGPPVGRVGAGQPPAPTGAHGRGGLGPAAD